MQTKPKQDIGHPSAKKIAENLQKWKGSFDNWYQYSYTISEGGNETKKLSRGNNEMAKTRSINPTQETVTTMEANGEAPETPEKARKKRTNSPVILFITYRNGGTQQSKPFDSKKVALAVADVYVNQPSLSVETEIVTVEVYRQVLKLARKES